MTEAADYMRNLLVMSATSVGQTLTAAGLDSGDYAFTVVLWPVGQPDRCSTICGSGDPGAQGESTLALAAASQKAAAQPTHVTKIITPKPN